MNQLLTILLNILQGQPVIHVVLQNPEDNSFCLAKLFTDQFVSLFAVRFRIFCNSQYYIIKSIANLFDGDAYVFNFESDEETSREDQEPVIVDVAHFWEEGMRNVKSQAGDRVAKLEFTWKVQHELTIAVSENSKHVFVHPVESVGVSFEKLLVLGCRGLKHQIISIRIIFLHIIIIEM